MAVDTIPYSQDGITGGWIRALGSNGDPTGAYLELAGINAANFQREVATRTLLGNNTTYKEDSTFQKFTGTVTVWAQRADLLAYCLPGSLSVVGNKATFTETATGLPTRFALYIKSGADGENGEDGVIGEIFPNCICQNWQNAKTSGEYVGFELTVTAIANSAGTVRQLIFDQDEVAFDTAATDTTAPTIDSVSPADSATGVAVDATVTVTFDEAMILSSLSGIKIYNPSTGAVVSTGVTLNAAKTVATVAHSDFATSTTYNLLVPDTCRDLAGNAIGTIQETSFTTTS